MSKNKNTKYLTKLFESVVNENDVSSMVDIDDFARELSFDLDPKGNLKIFFSDPKTTEQFSKVYNAHEFKDSDTVMSELFEVIMANGLSYISPEDIGALTDATIIYYDGKLFYDNDYAIRSPQKDLAEYGDTIFELFAELSDEEIENLFSRKNSLKEDKQDKRLTRAEIKERAQDMIMNAIAAKRGYWQESEIGLTPEEIAAIDEELRKQADRVAKMMGYEKSWSS